MVTSDSDLYKVTPTFSFIENHSSKVLNAKLCLMAVFWWNIVCVEFVLKVQLVQHGGICALKDTQRHRKIFLFDDLRQIGNYILLPKYLVKGK